MVSWTPKDILNEKLADSSKKLQLSCDWVFQQDMIQNMHPYPHKKSFKDNRIKLFIWPSQSSNLKPVWWADEENPQEMSWTVFESYILCLWFFIFFILSSIIPVDSLTPNGQSYVTQSIKCNCGSYCNNRTLSFLLFNTLPMHIFSWNVHIKWLLTFILLWLLNIHY